MAEIVYRFTGGHEPDGKPSQWHEGVPARDLAQDDMDGLDKDLRKLVDQSPIYAKAKDAAPKRPAAKKRSSTRSAPKVEAVAAQPPTERQGAEDVPPETEAVER